MIIRTIVALFVLTTYCYSFPIHWDSIGNNTYTNGTGGFSSQSSNDRYVGVYIEINGSESFTELRYINFSYEGSNVENFDYILNVWDYNDYTNNLSPTYIIDLNEPDSRIIFGNSGAGSNRDTYDSRFDLTQYTIFQDNFDAGQWVFEIYSDHTSVDGTHLVSGSISSGGPLPFFRTNESREILGDQDPNNLYIRWPINLNILIDGDFNDDGIVNLSDYTVWRDNSLSTEEYNLWKSNFGYSTFNLGKLPSAVANNVPESKSLITLILFLYLFSIARHIGKK